MKVRQFATMSARVKHTPLRRCVSCRKSLAKSELFRFFKDSNGNWQLDSEQRQGFRGMWLCNNSPECYDIKQLKKFFGKDTDRIAEEIKLNIKIQELKTPVKGG